MAESSYNKRMKLSVELPECPVCHQMYISAPIFICKSGHSVCNSCKNLESSVCPTCRRPITKIRNRQLEDLISDGATTKCLNKEYGCNYITRCHKIDDHLKECIYRVMKCPLISLQKCYWTGAHSKMVDHFKKFHPRNILMNLDEEVTINNISVTQDGRFVYIAPQGKQIYILTLQIDVIQKLAHWVVQVIAIKEVLKQHIYEINIRSQQEHRHKVTFNDYCFSYAIPTACIIKQSSCFSLSLPFFNKFIYEKGITFDLKIKYEPVFTTEPNTGPQIRGRSPSPQYGNPSTSK